MYFLWYLIRQKKTVVYENAENNCVWVFSPNGCRAFVGIAISGNCNELLNRETYFLFDAKPGKNNHEPVKCPAFLVIFSSPNDSSYKHVARSNVPKLGFTSPSYEELMLLGKALHIEEKDIHRKFIKYGPNIRFVITLLERNADSSIKKDIANFNASNVSLYIYGSNYDVTRRDNPSVLFKATVREDEFNTLTDAYWCTNLQWEFASKYIREKILDNYKNSSNDRVKSFLEASKGNTTTSFLRDYFLDLHDPIQ
jgi:hypothetical protein